MTVTEASRHLTASMVIIDPKRGKVLLVHHKAMDLWVFPGGHVDENETPGEAAVREVREETGLIVTLPGTEAHGAIRHPLPFLIEERPAPAKPERPGKPAEPAHTHIDMVFHTVADSTTPLAAELSEVTDARWVPIERLHLIDTRVEVPSVARYVLNKITKELS